MNEIDFVYQGPLYKTQKRNIHPQNHRFRSKPENVLWTSPMDPETGESAWMKWCQQENHETEYYEQNRWHIVPHEDCKILTLLPNSAEIDKYRIVSEFGDPRLDFEAIAKDYDALYIPHDTVFQYRHDLLDAWDIATCIFLKPKYTVMNDEMYALYKEGKLDLKNKEYKEPEDMQVNLHPRAIEPLQPKEVLDVSIDAAAKELQEIAKGHSKRSADARRETFLYYNIARKLNVAKRKGYACFFERDYETVLDNPAILEVLLKHGLNPNLKVKVNHKNFSLGQLTDDMRSFRLLLEYGANPDEMLNLSLKEASEYLVRLCLSVGANVNHADVNGVTPLMRARMPEYVELLLSVGANPLAVDKNGKSVQDYFNEEPIYRFRTINCKALEIAKQNLFVSEKMANVRDKLQRKVEIEEQEHSNSHLGHIRPSPQKIDPKNR